MQTSAPALTTPEVPDLMQFDCSSCSSTLAIPVEFAGVTGPCPFCQAIITAPTIEAWTEMHFPSPPALVEPAPHNEPKRLAIEPRVESDRSKALSRVLAGGPRLDSSGPNLPQLLGWGSVIITLAAGGFAFAVAKFTEPLKPALRTISLPIDLTQQVLKEKDRIESMREQSMDRAIQTVGAFLTAGSKGSGAPQFITLHEAIPEFAAGMFPDLKQDGLMASNCVRKPGTEEYLVTVEPKDGRGPVFIVEQQGGAMKIHADALDQQLQERIDAFLTTPGAPSLQAYVFARPSQNRHPLSQLSTWPKLDVQSPFPTEHPKAFIACAEPAGPSAAAINKRGEARHWAKVVMEFKWSKTTEGQDFIEISRVIPNAWSRF